MPVFEKEKFQKIIPDNKAGLLTGLFLLASLIWSLVTPLGASPDEGSHVQYAKVIISGKYFEVRENGYKVELPENIATINEKELCYYQNINSPSDCYVKIDQTKTSPFTISLRVPGYPPFYYAITGLPLGLDFSNQIWYLMRLFSVILCSFVFGLALFNVKNFIDSNSTYAILLAVTPMVTFLVGSVTPSSLEIVSGISLSIILLFYPRLKTAGAWTRSHTASVLLITLILYSARPFSGLMALSIYVSIFARHVKKISPIKYVILLSTLIGAGLLGIIIALKSGVQVSGRFLPPALPHQIIESQFSKLDNYLYDSIGYFAWIMSYRGIELIHVLWVAMILLAIAWSFQYFDNAERMGLLIISFASLIFIPLAVYYLIFKAGFGYQARYAMALICSIPLFAVIGKARNLPIPLNQVIFLLYFVPFANFSAWFISGYRSSHGLPFQLLDWNRQSFSLWLSPLQVLTCIILMFGYLILSKELIRKVKLNNSNYFSNRGLPSEI